MSSALFISEKEKDESANVGFFARSNSTGKKIQKHVHDSVAVKLDRQEGKEKE